MTKGIAIFLSVFLLSNMTMNSVDGKMCFATKYSDLIDNCTEVPTHLILDMKNKERDWVIDRLQTITQINQLTISNYIGKIIDFFPALEIIEENLIFERNPKLEGFLFPNLTEIGGSIDFVDDGYVFNLQKNKKNIKYMHYLEQSVGLTNACLNISVKVTDSKEIRELKTSEMKLELMRVILITFIILGMLLMCFSCGAIGNNIRNQKNKRKPFPIINFFKAVRENMYTR
ncbi:unnamed protein product [Caenorhabditis angaria]|uniref:Receptor L-domain domain-containing protein n=1 Tax=Caenorhabditis angaria TaxID=860376 RepID=A0A9P1IKW4_9PELO|nr:unnamed protein product [Caenorhabditis angaria]